MFITLAMSLNCGIVGLPNVGKSTIFSALTAHPAAAENYPFCTIDPNIGMVDVPDNRLDSLATIIRPKKIVPASMEFVDIAGLMKGASKGEGLGNRFLGHIRDVDAIVHVVRCFHDDDVAHVTGKVDPIADVETVNTELILSDMEILGRAKDKLQRAAHGGDRKASERIETILL